MTRMLCWTLHLPLDLELVQRNSAAEENTQDLFNQKGSSSFRRKLLPRSTKQRYFRIVNLGCPVKWGRRRTRHWLSVSCLIAIHKLRSVKLGCIVLYCTGLITLHMLSLNDVTCVASVPHELVLTTFVCSKMLACVAGGSGYPRELRSRTRVQKAAQVARRMGRSLVEFRSRLRRSRKFPRARSPRGN